MRRATVIVRALDDLRRAAVSMTSIGMMLAIGIPVAVVALVIWWPSDDNDPPR